jgi:Sulfotransferase family
VVFIAGYARSGSTLVERMLGQIDGFESFGELRHVWFRSFGENQLCGCGRPFRDCPFWIDVVADGFAGFDRIDSTSVERAQHTVDAFVNIPRILVGGWPKGYRRRLMEYLNALGCLYRSIYRVSGARYLVDASKDPQHAYILRLIPDIDVRVVHLVRDSRGVAFSWRRIRQRPEIFWERRLMPRYPVARTAMAWRVTNAGAEVARRLGMPYVGVRYEDLIVDPRRQLLRILDRLALEGPRDLGFLGEGTASLGPSHSVSGNPMRFATGEVPLRLDDEWQRAMRTVDWSVVTALTRSALRRYGYPADDRP